VTSIGDALDDVVRHPEKYLSGNGQHPAEDAYLGPVPRARLIRASSVAIERPTWVEDLRVPVAGVTLVAGREGMGKTAWTGHMAARLTRGQLPGHFFGHPADVVYVGDEDDRASVLVPRLVAAGADLDRVHFMDLPAGVPFSIGDDVDALDELCEPLDLLALVVIDPLDSHLGAGVDSHRKAEVQRAIGRLALLSQKHRCGMIGLAHLNKGDAHDLLVRVVGSVGFTTAVRSVLGIGEHPDDEADRVLVLAKSNLTDKTAVPAVRFRVEGVEVPHPDGSTVNTAAVVILGEELGIDPHSIVSNLGAEERTERDEAADWIAEYLSSGPRPYREVERAAADDGIARRTLHRAKDRLGVIVSRDKSVQGRPSTWALPGLVSPGLVSPPVSPSWHETKSLPDNGSVASEGVSCHLPGVRDETETDTATPPPVEPELADLLDDVARITRTFNATEVEEDLT
jgi:AAA domain